MDKATISRLINLNVELEGALRVLLDRESPEALESANATFAIMSELFSSDGHISEPDEETVNDSFDECDDSDSTELVAETDNIDVAEEAEQSDEIQPAAPTASCEPENEVPLANHEPMRVDDTGIAAFTVNSPARQSLRKMLTINDKFYYAREVFNGNESEFMETVDLISAMGNYDEAYEYLIEDLMLDSENPDVKDLLELITTYFNTRK